MSTPKVVVSIENVLHPLMVAQQYARLICSNEPELTDDVEQFVRELGRLGSELRSAVQASRSGDHGVP